MTQAITTYHARYRAARVVFMSACAFAVLCIVCAIALPITLAWSSLSQEALNEAVGGRSAEPLRVTMTVENRDGSALTADQAAKGFTFHVELTTSAGAPFAQPVSYTIYEPPVARDSSAAATQAASHASSQDAARAVAWDFAAGVPVRTGTFTGQTDITLVHGQWVETDRLPQGTLYRVEQTTERDYAHSADGPVGAIVAGGNQVDLLNIYDPAGLSVSKTLRNADGSALTEAQREQTFAFEVSFFRDGQLIEGPHPFEVYDEAGERVDQQTQSAQVVQEGASAGSDGEAPAGASSGGVEADADTRASADTTSEAFSSAISVSSAGVSGATSAEASDAARSSAASGITAIAATGATSSADDTTDAASAADVLSGDAARAALFAEAAPGTTLVALRHGQTAQFTGLEPGIQFSVRELDLEQSSTIAADAISFTGSVREGRVTPVAFTNVADAAASEVGSLHVGETVHRLEGELTDDDRAARFNYDLSFTDAAGAPWPSGTAFTYELYRYEHTLTGQARMAGLVPELDDAGVQIAGAVDSGGGTIQLSHGQVAVFNDLPAGMLWRVVEHPLDGYEQWYKQLDGQIFGGHTSRAPFNDEATERYVQISGQKTWDMSAAISAAGQLPGKYLADTARGLPTAASEAMPGSIVVRLVPTTGSSGTGGSVATRPTFEQTVYPDASGAWLYTFTVPAYDAQGRPINYETDYVLEEEPLEHFETEVDGFNVKNTYVAEGPTPPVDPDDPDGPDGPNNPDDPDDPGNAGQPDDPADPDVPGATQHPAATPGASGNASDDDQTALARTGDSVPLMAAVLALLGVVAALVAVLARRRLRALTAPRK